MIPGPNWRHLGDARLPLLQALNKQYNVEGRKYEKAVRYIAVHANLRFLARTLQRRVAAGNLEQLSFSEVFVSIENIIKDISDEAEEHFQHDRDDPDRIHWVTSTLLFRDRILQAHYNESDLETAQRRAQNDPLNRSVVQILDVLHNNPLRSIAGLYKVWFELREALRAGGFTEDMEWNVDSRLNMMYVFYEVFVDDNEVRRDLLANHEEFLDEELTEEAASWLRADPVAAARACNRYVREFYGGATPELRAMERAQRERDVAIVRR